MGDREDIPIRPAGAEDYQSGRQRSGGMHRDRRGATIEEIDRRRIAKNQGVEAIVLGLHLGDQRRNDRNRRSDKCVETRCETDEGGLRGGSLDPRLFFLAQRETRPCHDPLEHPRIANLPERIEMIGVDAVRFRGHDHPIDRSRLGEGRHVDVD